MATNEAKKPKLEPAMSQPTSHMEVDEAIDIELGSSDPRDAPSADREDDDDAAGGGTTTSSTYELEEDDEEQPPKNLHNHRRYGRSKSLGDVDHDMSYMYSFHIGKRKQEEPVVVTQDELSGSMHSCLPRSNSTASNSQDYNFVLDNYVEYADNTKIPRLRGKNVDKLRAAIQSSHPIALCCVLTVACFLTFSITNYAPNLRNDISQAIVITMVLATFPEVAASAGAGAFVGMASLATIPNHGWLTLLAFITSIVWLLFHKYNILVGCGGRLGTCAFIGMNLTLIVFIMPSGAVPWSMYGSLDSLWGERLELVPSILSVAASTFLSAVGGYIRLRSKIPLNPVQAPTTVALLCMLIVEPTGFKYTTQVDAGLSVGSFVAMASCTYLPSVVDFGLAGFVAGLWMLLLDPFFLDFGGKKGFTSFCGFATYVALVRLVTCGRQRPSEPSSATSSSSFGGGEKETSEKSS